MRKGFTLIECSLAGSIFCLMILVLFEGVIVGTRIAHENADMLAAEAVAWDAVWKKFNEDFDNIAIGKVTVTLTEEQAPQLLNYDTAPKLSVTVGYTDIEGFSSSATVMKKITADVEWGQSDRRRKLSDGGHCPQVFRGSMGRTY